MLEEPYLIGLNWGIDNALALIQKASKRWPKLSFAWVSHERRKKRRPNGSWKTWHNTEELEERDWANGNSF